MTLVAAFIQLQKHAIAAGAVDAPTHPTETSMAFPFSVVYPGNGRIGSESAGMEKDIHEIVMDVHVNRFDLPTDVASALGIFERLKPLIVADQTLAGAVDTIIYPFTYEFGEMSYASVKTLGFRYRITVKQKP